MTVDSVELLTRWPTLKPLVALVEPPWTFMMLDSGVLTGVRRHTHYLETLWVISEHCAGMHRRSLDHYDPLATTENFSGSLSDAVELLARSLSHQEVERWVATAADCDNRCGLTVNPGERFFRSS
jgi:hypothetical protein